MNLNRRDLLKILGVSASALALPFSRGLVAKDEIKRNYIFCYFDGGWDQLLCIDPRDPQKYTDKEASRYLTQPAYDQLGAGFGSDLIQPKGSNIAFGPAIGEFAKHYDKTCCIRGISMETVSHAIGMRYFLTGFMPVGRSAKGSSIGTRIAGAQGDLSPIPNLSVRLESYNSGYPSFATALAANSVDDLLTTLTPGARPDPQVFDLIMQARKRNRICKNEEDQALLDLFLNNQTKAVDLVAENLGKYFQFSNKNDPEMLALKSFFGIKNNSSAEARTAMAFQCIKHQICQSVSFEIAGGLDSHSEAWPEDQPLGLKSGFDLLSKLLDALGNEPHPQNSSDSLLDHTTIVVFSEFGRTPLLNSRGGRDHWITNSALLIGAGVPHNKVIGASSEIGMNASAINPLTGEPVETKGEMLTPKNILGSLLFHHGYDVSDMRITPLECLKA